MCFNAKPPTPVTPPAPPPPAPPPPEAPKPLPEAQPLKDSEDQMNPKVQYGRKKNEAILANAQGANALRIPMNIGNNNSGSGGLNA